MAKLITQAEALAFAEANPEQLTTAFTAGKRLYIGVNISDLGAGEEFRYLNPKDAPKAELGDDGVTRITVLDGAPLATVTAGLDQLGVTYKALPKGEYDSTVKIEATGLSQDQAHELMRDISYTSQTVRNAGADGTLVNAIQAVVNDAQKEEILTYWNGRGRTQADYLGLVKTIADIQVRDGAKLGDVYDDKITKLGNNRLVSGNNVAEKGGFTADGMYVRGKQEVRIIASEAYVLEGAGSRGAQHVDGQGILIYDLKEGKITGVRSSAEDHATTNGNFLDANGAALTSLAAVSKASAADIAAGAKLGTTARGGSQDVTSPVVEQRIA